MLMHSGANGMRVTYANYYQVQLEKSPGKEFLISIELFFLLFPTRKRENHVRNRVDPEILEKKEIL